MWWLQVHDIAVQSKMYCLLYAVAPLSKSTIPQYGHGAVRFHIYSNLDSDVLITLQSTL